MTASVGLRRTPVSRGNLLDSFVARVMTHIRSCILHRTFFLARPPVVVRVTP